MPVLTTEVIAYRQERLLELGFTPDQAVEIAEARDSKGNLPDLHEIEAVIAAGCTIAQAYAIYA